MGKGELRSGGTSTGRSGGGGFRVARIENFGRLRPPASHAWMSAVVAIGCFASWAMAQPLTNPGAVRGWAKAVLQGRADIVLFGDSNVAYNGHGFDAGMTRAARAFVDSYGTGLLWFGENRGLGAGLGDGYGTIAGSSGFSYDGSPIDAANVANDFTQYLYLAAPSQLNGARQGGLWTGPEAVDARSNLRWHVTEGTFPGGGSWRPTVRLGVPPYTLVADFGTVSTQGALGLRTTSLSLPADATRAPLLEWRLAPFSFATQFVGNLLAVRSRVEDFNIGRGAAVHSYFFAGGRSSRWMAACVEATSDAAIAAYLMDVRRTCDHVLVVINQGLNDRSETSPSIRGIRPGNSPAAFVDNMTYVIDRVRGAWVSQGWSLDQLHVLVCVAHPVSTPQSPELQAYLYAMRALARTDIAVTSLAEYHTEATYAARGWYATTTDRTHLSTAGYDATSMTLLQSVLATACDADFNGDGGVDGTDVESFFLAFLDAAPECDVNVDGGVDGSDVEAFIRAWSSGC